MGYHDIDRGFKLVAEMAKNQAEYYTENSFKPGELITGVWNIDSLYTCEAMPFENARCPNCKGSTGWKVINSHVADGQITWVCIENDCRERIRKVPLYRAKKKLPEEILELAGVERFLRHATFEDWRHSEDLKSDLKRWSKTPKGACVLSGSCGIGKTYMAACMILHHNQSREGTVRFINIVDMKYRWQEESMSGASRKLSAQLQRCDMLVIDDIDKTKLTDGFFDFLYLIINSRYSSMKSTIITTNLSFSDLSQFLGTAIMSRLGTKEGLSIEVEGEDQRI